MLAQKLLKTLSRTLCAPADFIITEIGGRLCPQARGQPLTAALKSRPAAAGGHLSLHRLPGRALVAASAAQMTVDEATCAAGTNPLLADAPLPLFDQVQAEHVVPGITALVAQLNTEIDALEQRVVPTWEGLVEPLERISDRMDRAWGTVSHLKAVKDSEALRKAVEEVQPLKVQLALRLSQSRPLYEAYRALRESDAWDSMPEARKRAIEGELRDFVLGGVALEGDAKERFNEMQQERSQLATQFSNNLLDATKAFKRLATRKEEVEGLPESALELAAQSARNDGHEGATPEAGPWQFGLDMPSLFPVLSHAKDRELREALYRAHISRASSGETDNTPLIERTLALRREQAQLLGYANYAEVSMASKMATLEKAEALLEELRVASVEAARRDLDEVSAFAAEQGFEGKLQHWDVNYWAERLREARYQLTDEQLRPYFALPNVLDGLFQLAERLFGVTVERADGRAPVWHPDVQFFALARDGRPKACFYLDPYSRPAEKRGGAWMDEVVGQSRLFAEPGSAVRLPVAHMGSPLVQVCNQTPPIGEKPSLMTFREVETLFHEFGHALQHMLTEQADGLVAGIRGIEWDAVELPSQFMEGWCYDRPTLDLFARHYQTGEPLPDDLFQKLTAARNFRSGSVTLRQVQYAAIDLELHARYAPAPGRTVFDGALDAVVARTTVMPPLPEDRFLCGFAHIFAGGYSAGYYSYKWAEVLSADAFSAFEEVLGDDAAVRDTGRRFRDTVLALGGGRAPDAVFRDFRGRDPSTEPLLRQSGLVLAPA